MSCCRAVNVNAVLEFVPGFAEGKEGRLQRKRERSVEAEDVAGLAFWYGNAAARDKQGIRLGSERISVSFS